jgi:hypothetical protein
MLMWLIVEELHHHGVAGQSSLQQALQIESIWEFSSRQQELVIQGPCPLQICCSGLCWVLLQTHESLTMGGLMRFVDSSKRLVKGE